MDSAKAQLADKIKASTNILVTVSRNPSVDQLSALLGLTMGLNKLGKHAAAVFSGQVPSTLEFLRADDTFEKNTDSLRDFIIALDKSKADKLRYKVEDDVVRIFITPYRTSISDADLEFSQGDFNVDLVVAIGVRQQEDLDEAITAHGRILHDATVSAINLSPDSGLGSINWYDQHSSSLCELVTELIQSLGDSLLDEQISTALLTGIVAETHRFSNEKTSSQTMSLSAALMAAGANQQLIATKLEEPVLKVDNNRDNNDDDSNGSSQGSVPSSDPPKPDDGTIEIDHENDKKEDQPDDNPPQPAFELPSPQPDEPQQDEIADLPGVIIDEEPNVEIIPPEPIDILSPGPKLMVDPPSLGGTLTANSTPEVLDPSSDPLGVSNEPHRKLLSRDAEEPLPAVEMTPPPASWAPPTPDPVVPEPPTPDPVVPEPPAPEPVVIEPPTPELPASEPVTPEPDFDQADKTLTELEASVGSSHISSPDLGDARDEVSRALVSDEASAPAPEPIQALSAQPFGASLHAADPPIHLDDAAPADSNDPSFVGPMLEDILSPQSEDKPAPTPLVIDPNAPPPVPPPIPFKFGSPDSPQQ